MGVVFGLALTLTACEEDRLLIVPDLGFPDLGPIPDLGEPDLGVEEMDAGPDDLGPPDLGPADLGPPDLGRPDVGVPPATEAIYIHTGSALFSYDPAQHVATELGTFRDANGPLEDPMVDIAIDRFGTLYGGSGASRDDKRVYLIDPNTAFCQPLFIVDDNLNGMAFDGRGRLIAAGDTLRVLDTSDGARVLTFENAGSQFTTSGDVVGLPDGNIYWTVTGDGNADRLVRLDPISGATQLLGTLTRDNLFGLGYANGELFGFTSSGEVVVINPSTGRVTAERSLPGSWYGATTNPVAW